MGDTGQVSVSHSAKPGSKKEIHCQWRAYLQFLTIIFSLALQNNDSCMF